MSRSCQGRDVETLILTLRYFTGSKPWLSQDRSCQSQDRFCQSQDRSCQGLDIQTLILTLAKARCWDFDLDFEIFHWKQAMAESRLILPKSRLILPKSRSILPKSRSILPKSRLILPQSRSILPRARCWDFDLDFGKSEMLRLWSWLWDISLEASHGWVKIDLAKG